MIKILLKNKNAIVYGGSGMVGSAVARAFAREGASVFLVGRTSETLAKVAAEITAAGGRAETEQMDAFNEEAVNQHAQKVFKQAGSIDISFNALMFADVQKPILDMACDEFTQSVTNAVRSQFLSAHAVAQYMLKQGTGVILTVTGYGPPTPGLGNTGVIWGTVESICRQLASDLGPHGIRVSWLRTGGLYESFTNPPPYETSFAPDMSNEELLKWLEGETMLKRLPSAEEMGDLAAFLASDKAGSLTATAVNITSGSVAD